MNPDSQSAAGREQPLVAAFPNQESADKAAKMLRREGFRKQSLGLTEVPHIERTYDPRAVILTVDGSNHPEFAAWILEHFGGTILAGESFGLEPIDWTAAGERRGSAILGYRDPSEYARGRRVDDDDRQRLRTERLQSDALPTVSEDVFVRQGVPDNSRNGANHSH